MKFTAKQSDFSNAMTALSKIVETRNTYPILANVVITAEANGLKLRATDLDIEVTMQVPAQIEKGGETTVPARVLADILRKMKGNGDVAFTFEGGSNATITSGRSRFQLQVLSSDSFPNLKSGAFDGRFVMTGNELAEVIKSVSFAILLDETRYYLQGICFDPKDDGTINFVATDGHRLARMPKAVHVEGRMSKIIVPRKTVAELERLAIEAGEAEMKFEVNDSKISVVSGSTTMLSKLVEGTYPDYDRVTPKNNNTIAMMELKAIVSAADRVSTMASDRSGKAVKLSFGPGLVSLQVISADHGQADEDVPIDYDAAPLEIGFNARYLADALGVFGKGTIRLAVQDPGSPAVLTSESIKGLTVVLMPMRVN